MENNKPLIILASARKQSDTGKLVNQLFDSADYNLIDLLDYKIYNYSYAGAYPADDDFLILIEKILQHENLIFATPVYWYSMSAHLKNFFDRLTDLVTIKKNLGRSMAGKKTFLISVSSEKNLPEGFEVPFKEVAEYFNMTFVAGFHCQNEQIDNVKQGSLKVNKPHQLHQ